MFRCIRAAHLACAAIVCCSVVTPVGASEIPWYNKDPAIKPDIPDNDISDEAIEQGAQCAEAASTNIIEYFDAHGFPNLMPPGQTAEQLMIALADTDYDLTRLAGPERGLNYFFKQRGYENRLKAHTVDPISWDSIISEMKKGQLLLISIRVEGETEGHMMTIAGWDATPNKQIGVHDINAPVTGSDHTTSVGGTDFYKLTIDDDGNMSFKYGGDKVYSVTRLTAVSPVPEPATWVVAVFGLGFVAASRRSAPADKSTCDGSRIGMCE